MGNNIIELEKSIENIINKYRCQISHFLSKPHLDFVNSEKSSFVIKDFSCSSDSEIEWKYYYNTNNPGGYFLGYDMTIISLQKDIIPAIKKLLVMTPKTKKQKRKDVCKNAVNIGLFLMGSELSLGDSLAELSDEEKGELSDIICRYEEMINNQNSNLSDREGSNIFDLLLHTDKPLQYKNHPIFKEDDIIWYGNKTDPCIIAIVIITQDSSGNPKHVLMQLIDSKDQSRIFRQASKEDLQEALDIACIWLEHELDQCSKRQEQEKQSNSNNRGEKEVEYHIKWALKTLNKYVVSINSDCESKYRYNCILLKNSSFIDDPQEYDHILVTPSGVVLIETKDWKGTIDITSDGKWIRHKEEDGTAYGVASPISQMRRHEQLMKSILPDVPVYSILCFSNPSAIINGKEDINEYPVINIEQLETELNKICSRNKYSNENIDEIVTTIDSYKINKMQ